jgi:hypothetical protein
MFGFKPSTFRLFGSVVNFSSMFGSAVELTPTLINKGIAPILFDAARTANNIIIYRQKAFFPVKDDSRWFMTI